MKIFITGGSGFIGRTLVPMLREEHEVKLGSFTTICSADAVIHMAAIKRCSDASMAAHINVSGTQRLLEAYSNIKRFIFLSTYQVYGWQEEDIRINGPSCEWQELRPIGVYAQTKALAEEIVRQSGIPYTIIRLSHVFGPGGDDIVNTFIKSNPIVVHGGFSSAVGLNTIDLIRLEDACRYIKFLLTEPMALNQTVNVGSGEPWPIIRLAHFIGELRGVPIVEERTHSRIPSRAISIAKLHSWTGIPPRPVSESIREYVESQCVSSS